MKNNAPAIAVFLLLAAHAAALCAQEAPPEAASTSTSSAAPTRAAVELEPRAECPVKFSLNAYADVETAYICRGLVFDRHPFSAQFVEGVADFGPLGRINGYVWTMSAFTGDGTSADMTRYAYNEADYGVRYFYDLALCEDCTLRTGVGHQWATNPGFRNGHTLHDWQFLQSLENPIVTPYWRFRRFMAPYEATWWCIGLRRSFALAEKLSLSFDFFGDLGNSRHFRHLYGPKPSNPGSNYHGGLQALNLIVRLDYALTENVGVYGFVGQYCVVSEDVRETLKASDAAEARRDLTYGGVGISFSF